MCECSMHGNTFKYWIISAMYSTNNIRLLTGVVQLVGDCWGFTTSQVWVPARIVIAISGKSQKPIEYGVCVSLGSLSSGLSW